MLAEVVTALGEDLTAGAALDLGCGDGADTVWLAARGWRVLAVDVAASALQRLSARAAQEGVGERVRTERHDLAASFPAGRFDLVTAHFLHAAAPVLRRGASAVASGGLLLVVDHGSVAPWSWDQDQTFPTARQALEDLALTPSDWLEHAVEARQRTATGPGGATAVVTDHVLALRRR